MKCSTSYLFGWSRLGRSRNDWRVIFEARAAKGRR